MPDIRQTGTVGYRTVEFHDIDSIRLTPANQASLFAPDRTAFIDLIIRREQEPLVFRFSDCP